MTTNMPTLTSLRFFAALWILLFHLRIHLGTKQSPWLELPLQAGPLAMSFFFVLSGFILTVSCQGKDPCKDYGSYLLRRFARIYPLYLAYLFVAWPVIGFGASSADASFGSAALLGLADLTLVNGWFPQLFSGGLGRDGTWSLSVELFFYLLFPFLLLHARQMGDRALLLATAWMVIIAAMGAIMGRYLPPHGSINEAVYYSLPIFRLPEFFAGVAYATWLLRAPARSPSGLALAMLGVTLVVFLLFFARLLPYVGNDLALIPFLLALLGYAMRSDGGLLHRFLSLRPLVFLGEMSFAIYVVQIITVGLYRQPGREPGWLGGAWGCFALTMLVAAAAHLSIEKPARKWILSRSQPTA